MDMNSNEFSRYLTSMLSSFADDENILDTLKIGYSLYVLGRGQYVKDRYIEKNDPKSMITTYVRARMLLENLFIEFGAIEIVDEEFTVIDEYIKKKYLTHGAMVKISNAETKEYLKKEHNFTDTKIKEIFKVYNEIFQRDPILQSTLAIDTEEELMINEYIDDIKNRTEQYINNLGT